MNRRGKRCSNRLAEFLSRHTNARISLAPGAGTLQEIFDSRHCSELEGGVLEAIAQRCKRAGHVLAKIRQGDSGWEEQVPPRVAEVIKSRGLFRYRPGGYT